MRALMGWLAKEFRGQVVVGLVLFILSACTAPTQSPSHPTAQPAPGNSPLAIRNLQQAAYYYDCYHELAPDDLLGLKRLTEVCAALEDPSTVSERQPELHALRAGAGVEDESCREAAALQEALEAKTDDRRIVAELLGVPVEDVELGPNLVENGSAIALQASAQESPLPTGWEWDTWISSDKERFRGGSDRLEYDRSTFRVAGFWLRDIGEVGARAGYWANSVSLDANKVYVVSFLYKTLGDAKASVYLTDLQGILFRYDRFLPETSGTWRRCVIVGENMLPQQQDIRPLVRNWGKGSVWFTGLQVQEVDVDSELRPVSEAILLVEP